MSGRLDRVVNGQNTTDLECSICIDLIKDARQLQNCEHMYCHECITDVLRNGTDTEGHKEAKCPTCMQAFTESSIIQKCYTEI